jgi:uncharacterized protein
MKHRLHGALREALRSRDVIAIAALRGALAAIDNAQAVPGDGGPAPLGVGKVAKARLGAGAAEMPRRELSEDDIATILRREIVERESAAADYEARGRRAEAARLRAEGRVITAHLTP